MAVKKPGAALVISLDFELHWGVAETMQTLDHPYAANLKGAREAIPRLLSTFERRGIHASWATVGMLFARGGSDLESFKPEVQPNYENDAVNNYSVVVGESETQDPLHFAPSLIEQIHSTPGQEIACHTFSHYYCDEPGQSLSEFRADIESAKKIAERDGVELRSLVFPRNQVVSEYLQVVEDVKMCCYRGNPSGAMYHLPDSGIKRHLVRIARLLDSYVSITGRNTVSWDHIKSDKIADVRASQFLRPYSRKLKAFEYFRRNRVISGMRAAAKRGEIYHLWWHPHNFGQNLNENMLALEFILDEFENLKSEFDMQSLTMAEVADLAR